MAYRADGAVGANWLRLTSTGTVAISAPSIISLTGSAIGLNADTGISGGLVIGDVNIDPLTGVLVMKERTAATAATVADTAQIWVQDVAGVQKFYIKFANGVQREIATA